MMKLGIKSIVLIFASLIMGCKGKKETHGHNSDSHMHVKNSKAHSTENYFGAYSLEDEKYGTKTKVTIMEDVRVMLTNSLPNHETGVFPNEGNPNTISAQNRSFSFPLHPKYTGKATWIRETGIALNGIKFEPGTGEVVACESGESYRVEAMQDVIDMGLDYNHAHVQPTGAYHYHGSPTEIIKELDTGEDLVHVGFAHDGFPMYYSKSNAYKPSFKLVEGEREGQDCAYTRPGIHVDIAEGGHHDGTFNSDYEYVAGMGDLDECNGITIDEEYMYLVTAAFPYIGRCLMGEFKSQERGGGPSRNADQGDRRPEGQGRSRGRLSVDEVFKELDVNADGKIAKKEAKGPLSQKFNQVDLNADGFISKAELKKDIPNKNAVKPRN